MTRNVYTASSRDVDVVLIAIRTDRLDLKQALAHDEIDGLSADVLPTKARDNLAERFNQTTNLDGADSGS